uniref:Secreted protein n=1 Tax=Meloidogyne incognita TaxID=6306 RepID=A0A914MQ38_MELIC
MSARRAWTILRLHPLLVLLLLLVGQVVHLPLGHQLIQEDHFLQYHHFHVVHLFLGSHPVLSDHLGQVHL